MMSPGDPEYCQKRCSFALQSCNRNGETPLNMQSRLQETFQKMDFFTGAGGGIRTKIRKIRNRQPCPLRYAGMERPPAAALATAFYRRH